MYLKRILVQLIAFLYHEENNKDEENVIPKNSTIIIGNFYNPYNDEISSQMDKLKELI